jgi:hypothetical protein
MASTFCNTPLTETGWHRVKTGNGNYIMSPYWIDTTSPNDMMDYDFTAPISELKESHAQTHRQWCELQCRDNCTPASSVVKTYHAKG